MEPRIVQAPARLGRSRRFGLLLFTLGSVLFALNGMAATRAEDASEGVAGTPRAALELFLKATKAGRYSQATVVFPDDSPANAESARELRAVIDEYLTINLSQLSETATGGPETIGRIPTPTGSEPIRLMRAPSGKWVFTPTTLERIPTWYAALPDQWIRSRLPDPLLRAGPRDVLWWQWIALVPIALIAFAVGALLGWLVRLLLGPLTRRFDPHGLQRLSGPLILLAAVAVGGELSAHLFFTLPTEAFLQSLQSALALLAVFWGLLRCVDIGIDVLRGASFAQGRPERLALLPLFSKASKLGLASLAIVEVLQRLGYPVTSLIAGLGIGGLAVALAAQKTVADLFGSVVLGIDQPFRPGDFVKIDDLSGTVESIGLRSTRFRTLNRTLVTLPNGRLADMKIESFAPRDRTRVDFNLSLSRQTKVEQIQQIIADVGAALRQHPKIHADPPTVFLTALTNTGFDVSIGFSFDTLSDDVFQQARQEILLQILRIVEQQGAMLAIPPRDIRFTETRAVTQ